MHNARYVHGYSDREAERLHDQAQTLTELLHHDTRYPPGSKVLEAGCGVGAQTITLVSQSPDAMFTCIDCSDASLVLRLRHGSAMRDTRTPRSGMLTSTTSPSRPKVSTTSLSVSSLNTSRIPKGHYQTSKTC